MCKTLLLSFLLSLTFTLQADLDWAKKQVEKYQEIKWLGKREVKGTEEANATEGEAYSVQIFGEKFIEFDRTLMTLHCLDLMLDGTYQSYLKFTDAQPKGVKLSRRGFLDLHLQGQRLLKSRWQGLSEKEMRASMEVALVLGDMGKSKTARDLFEKYGARAPDHDDFYGEALKILEEQPQLCPSFAKLSAASKKLLCRVANLAHFGHITHLEGGKAMYKKLKESEIAIKDKMALSFDLFVHTADVAGALGHVNKDSSIVYNEQTHLAMKEMGESIYTLSDPDKTEIDAFNTYLSKRAEWLGLDSENKTHRVLTRIGAMLRLFSKEEGEVLKRAVSHLKEEERAKIINHLDVQESSFEGRTPTYIPAVLVNLMGNKDLGSSKDERLEKAIFLGLPFISRVLDKHSELLSQLKFDPQIPLNFNQIAGVAKKDPSDIELCLFDIDDQGAVFLYEKGDFESLQNEERWEEMVLLGEKILSLNPTKDEQFRILNQLVSSYFYLGNYSYALEKANQMIELGEVLNDSRAFVTGLYKLSASLRALGEKKNEEMFFKQALEYCEKALNLCNERCSEDSLLRAKVLFNLGAAKCDHPSGDHLSGIEDYQKALELFSSLGEKNYHQRTLIRLGKAHLLKQDLEQTKVFLDQLDGDKMNKRTKMHLLYLQAQVQILENPSEAAKSIEQGKKLAKSLDAAEELSRFEALSKAISVN